MNIVDLFGQLDFIIILSVGLLTHAVGFAILFAGYRNKENVNFFLLCTFIGIWTVINYLSTSYIGNSVLTTNLINLVFIVTIPFAYFFRGLAYAVTLTEPKSLNKIYNYISIGLVIIVSIFGIAESVTFTGDNISPNMNPLILFYFLYIIYSFSDAVVTYLRSMKNIDLRNKIRTILAGLVVSTTFIIFTNLILVVFFNTSIGIRVGPTFLILFIVVTFNAIIKRQLFGTRFLLGTFAYYLLTSILPFSAFFIVGSIFIILTGSLINSFTLFVGLIISFLFSVLYNFTNNVLRNKVYTKLINPGYDLYEAINSTNKALSNQLTLNEIKSSVYSSIKKTIRPEIVQIIANNEPNTNTLRSDEFNLSMNLKQKLFQSFVDTNVEFIVSNGGAGFIINSSGSRHIGNMNDVYSANVRGIIPITSKEKIIGIIILGKKEADAPYTSIDIDLLKSIASTTALAIERSQLYQEVKDFNESLQRKIEQATKNLRIQNENLEMALVRLERIRQQEQDMLDVLGHELRTPITIVRNALSVLKMDSDKKEIPLDQNKVESYVKKALASTKREMVLIETLLAATKIDANRVQLNLEKVDLIDVIETAIDGHEQLAKERGLEIIFEKPEMGEWKVYADRTRIQEIQDNFLSNAVKYTLKGTITIRLRKTKHVETNEDLIHVSVIDTGIGIPKEDIPKLGRKFFRARQYISSEAEKGAVVRPGGTGLGLYVTFELIKLMKGVLSVESELGKGSTFGYGLPLFKGQEKKHIDQTFDQDESLEEQIKVMNIREKIKQNQDRYGYMTINDGPSQKSEESSENELSSKSTESTQSSGEIVKTQGANSIDTKRDKGDVANLEATGAFTKISTANDIIKKINDTRRELDNDKTESEEPIN